MKVKNLVILIIILVLAGLAFGFSYWLKNVKPSVGAPPPRSPADSEKRQILEKEGSFDAVSPPLRGAPIIEEK